MCLMNDHRHLAQICYKLVQNSLCFSILHVKFLPRQNKLECFYIIYYNINLAEILKFELGTSTPCDNCDFYYFSVPLKDPSLQI